MVDLWCTCSPPEAIGCFIFIMPKSELMQDLEYIIKVSFLKRANESNICLRQGVVGATPQWVLVVLFCKVLK